MAIINYVIGGQSASIGPHTQTWRLMKVGTDHKQKPIYSRFAEVDLTFPPCSITMAKQWLDLTSATSTTITMLDRYQVSFATYTGVTIEATQEPPVQAGHAGEFSIVVRGVEWQ